MSKPKFWKPSAPDGDCQCTRQENRPIVSREWVRKVAVEIAQLHYVDYSVPALVERLREAGVRVKEAADER